MRLDKLLSNTGVCSRSECSKAAKRGEITVNGIKVYSSDHKVDEEKDTVIYCGRKINYRKFTYILMNKPSGVVSSTDGKDGETVIDLLPEKIKKIGVFPCGRLDKDTVGVLLITNDGETAHRLLSPKKHVKKTYFVRSEKKVSDDDLKKLESGMTLDGGDVTLPAETKRVGENEFYISISEGMYHQIKRMLERVGNKVIYLERTAFGPLKIEDSPERGQWRYLTEEEERALRTVRSEE